MAVRATSISGLFIVEREMLEDRRGFFRETYRASELAEAVGSDVIFRQSNHSRSHPRVLRGFHAEPWSKLVYVVRGLATVAVADTRPDSPTFGRAETFLVGDAPGARIRVFVAQGLSNAFYCHTEVDYLNDVTGEYRPDGRGGVRWDDPDLAVDWPDRDPILSAADTALPTLRQLHPSRMSRS